MNNDKWSEQILQKTNRGADVFKAYFSPDVIEKGVRHNFCNVLRGEKNPSCRMRYSSVSNKWCLKDWGQNSEWSGDCFHVVARYEGFGDTNIDNRGTSPEDFLMNTAFGKAIRAIDQNFHLGVIPEKYLKNMKDYKLAQGEKRIVSKVKFDDTDSENRNKLIKYDTRYFRDSDMAFWGKYGINKETLDRYNVVAINTMTLQRPNGTKYHLYGNGKEHPRYAYMFNGGKTMKVYDPFPQVNKITHMPYPRFSWYNHPRETEIIFGLEQLPARGDRVYITGGEKDVMSLAAHGFNAVAFNSETARLNEKVLDNLAGRFDNIIILYDTDNTGIKESKERFKELKDDYPVARVELPFDGPATEPGKKPENKDISDFFKLGRTAEELTKLTDSAVSAANAERAERKPAHYTL